MHRRGVLLLQVPRLFVIFPNLNSLPLLWGKGSQPLLAILAVLGVVVPQERVACILPKFEFRFNQLPRPVPVWLQESCGDG